MDSLGTNTEEHLAAYPPDKVITFPPEKDFTDTELALSLAGEKGCEKLWIIGGGGGRVDHLFGIRSLFEREHPPLRWITAKEDIHCVEADSKIIPAELISAELTSSETNTRTKERVSVFPLGEGPWEAESSGLKWPLAGLPWNRGFYGLSNEAPEGSFSIKAKQGRFLVIINYDD
jgi:thiamine pyrophosphokinase